MAATPTPPPNLAALIPSDTPLYELRISKDAAEWLKTLSPDYFQTNEDLEHAWASPFTQFGLTLLKDSEFKSACLQIRNAHMGVNLIGYELVLIAVLWTFRAWKLQKATTLLQKLLSQAWIAMLFWGIAILGIPWVLYGGAYGVVLKGVFRAVLRHFFA